MGSHVVDGLLASGHEVLVIDDLSSGRRENLAPNAIFEELDIRKGEKVNEVFKRFRPHAVSHQAAQTSVSVSTREPLRDAEINVLGTLNILEAAVTVDVERVAFASTGGAIYGEVPEGTRAGLHTPPEPLSPYACSKFAAEAYLHRYQEVKGIQAHILRYANVYGPRQDPHGEAGVVAIFCQRILAGEPIQINAMKTEGDDGCIRDYVYVEDVVQANLMALEGELEAEIVNIATGQETTTLELANTIQQQAGPSQNGKQVEMHRAPMREGDLQRSVLEPTLPVETSLAQGLAQTVDWFRSRPI